MDLPAVLLFPAYVGTFRFSFLKCQVTVMIRLSAFLSVSLLPLPSNDAFYNIIFRLSVRCTRLRLPFGFARFYNFADEVF
jgi:hypothetical protein